MAAISRAHQTKSLLTAASYCVPTALLSKGLGMSQMGVAEKFLRHSYDTGVDDDTLEVVSVNITSRAAGLMVAPHSWTWRGRLNFQLAFMAGVYRPDSCQQILRNMVKVVEDISGRHGGWQVVEDWSPRGH